MSLSASGGVGIGVGPASSRMMGPMAAAARFPDDLRRGTKRAEGSGEAARPGASLPGSPAFTGEGHATDRPVILGPIGFLPGTPDPDAVNLPEC